MTGVQIVPELQDTKEKIGAMTTICKFCGARKWAKETPSMCCNSGKVVLDSFPDPPKLLKELLIADTSEARLFRNNARPLNNALTLSSLQVRTKTFDSGFAPNIIFEGKVCQWIGPMLPEEGKEPKFAQLYVHDPATEHTQRVKNMSLPKAMNNKEIDIITDIMIKLQQMLKEINPFVKDVLHIERRS